MDRLLQDVRFAFRTLRRDVGFTAAAVLTLALGIGALTAIYSVVDGVLLRPLPYRDADRIVRVHEGDRHSGTTREGFSAPDLYDLRERTRTLTAVAAYRTQPRSLLADGGAERVIVTAASHELFALLGVAPVLGRVYGAAEDAPGGEPVAVLSEDAWRRRFGGSPDAIGATVRVDGVVHTVIGVVPSAFAYPTAATALWVPLQATPTSASRGVHDLTVAARLAPGATLDDARRELRRIAAELEAAFPADNEGRTMYAEPLRDVMFGSVRSPLLVLLAAVAVVLLIGCVNVANLLLARGTARRREVAVRAALGATTGRLARQFAAEMLVLVLIAGAIGVGIAFWSLDALLALAPRGVPRLEGVGIDARVLAAVAGTLVAVGLGFGLVPTLQARRTDVRAGLAAGGERGGSDARDGMRVRGILVAAEVALAVVLVTGAGLLTQSFWRLTRVDPGFRAERLLKFEFTLPASRYPQRFDRFPDYPEVRGFYASLRREVGVVPGVRAAALAMAHPLDPAWTTSFRLDGQTAEEAERQPEVVLRPVSPGYLDAAGVRLIQGRPVGDRDDDAAPPVAMVNEAFVRAYLRDGEAIGRRITFFGREREIIGVIGDERFDGPGAPSRPAVYPPLRQVPIPSATLLVRTDADPEAVIAAVRRIFDRLDPELAVFDVEPLTRTLSRTVAQPRFTMMLLGLFGGLSLVLAAIGVHGVLSYAIARRSHEIGVRIALGATRAEVVLMVLRQGMRPALLGLAAGSAGAFAAARLLRGLLFGIGPADPLTYAATAAVLGAVALGACWLPARRAAAIEPMVTLRRP
ncbi:MAG TPA: ABC transporter permease [Longimicrobiales bacterium]